MKKIISFLLLLFLASFCSAQVYKSLDTKNPIVFDGDDISYKGKNIKLGPKAFFIDGQLSDEETRKHKYVFNSINEAAKHLTNGTEESPMTLYIAPYVYWLDDPDDPAIRIPKPGTTYLGLKIPFALEINCEWLKFYGLSDNAENVVLACNRGQSMGAQGDFALLHVSGQGTCAENVTFGNYCNVDLVYPLKPSLNRKRRAAAITQAAVIMCEGDKLVARNTRFISRLDLFPYLGGKRVLFDRCHFESTDDALNPTAVYLNCSFEFCSERPFFATSGTGAVLFNCDIKSFTKGNQYFTKFGGQLAMIDTRFESNTVTYLDWRDYPTPDSRSYVYNFQFNGKPYVIGAHHPQSTVDMAGRKILDAYLFPYNGKVIYNTYNLLRGDDDWDPMGIKQLVLAAEKKDRKQYTNLPTQIIIPPVLNTTKDGEAHFQPAIRRSNFPDTIETGKKSVELQAQINRFGNYEMKGGNINWKIAPAYKSIADLKVNKDGTCTIIPKNYSDDAKEVIVTASTPEGLEAASALYVLPPILDAPKFTKLPVITNSTDGKLSVAYRLDTKFKDQSLISWYRCSNANGSNPIEVAVSRFNKPKLDYTLSAGDAGYYIMATVTPKHIRSNSGSVVHTITSKPVSEKDVKADNKVMVADLKSLSTKYQSKVIPGFWTFDAHVPESDYVNERNLKADSSSDPWYYGAGTNGSVNDTGWVQASPGARLRYTHVGESFGDMKITFTAVPAKTAGQGFSVAGEYMDVFIKFDTKTLDGYALRFTRTTKYHDAIDMVFMKYENGKATAISKPVSTSCYRPNCYITVEAKGNKLIAHASSKTKPDEQRRPEVFSVVDMETEISSNKFGGFGFQYTNGIGTGATLIKDLKIEWK